MSFTTQQYALDRAQKKFGASAYTVHHLHYKLVGCERNGKRLFCLGESWEEALEGLERKAQ